METRIIKTWLTKESLRREGIKKTIQNQIFINRRREDWYQKHSMDFADHYIPEHPEIWEDFVSDQQKVLDMVEAHYYG